MKHRQLALLLFFASTILTTVGCVSTSTEIVDSTEQEPRVVHTVVASPPSVCGALDEFLIDAHKLDGSQRSTLINELSGFDPNEFSCDRLKTGLLFSQIGKSMSEDDQAIEILAEFRGSDKLNESEHRLIDLVIQHSEERRRLHILLKQLGDKLIAEQTLSKTMSTDLLTLQQKLNQLQKIEADINETEQSISAPTSSSLNTDGSENTGS
ncbi:MAG: hypothetical protein ACR2QW_08080 [bacterium]